MNIQTLLSEVVEAKQRIALSYKIAICKYSVVSNTSAFQAKIAGAEPTTCSIANNKKNLFCHLDERICFYNLLLALCWNSSEVERHSCEVRVEIAKFSSSSKWLLAIELNGKNEIKGDTNEYYF